MPRPRNPGATPKTRQADREEREVHTPDELLALLALRDRALNLDDSMAGAGREAVTILRALLREELAEGAKGKVKPSTSRTRASQMAAMLAKSTEPEKRVEAAMNDLRELGDEVERIKGRHAARNIRAATPTAPGPTLPQ